MPGADGQLEREPLPEDLDVNLGAVRAGAKGRQTHIPGRSEPKHSKVISSEERLEQRLFARHDCRTTPGKSVDELPLRAGNVLHRTEKLEMHGPDARNHSDVGSGDCAKLGDLSQPAHSHLQDDHLCVGFDPAERQGQADLVVLTPFRDNSRRVRATERAQNVLRGRLPDRAGDRGNASGRALAYRSTQRR